MSLSHHAETVARLLAESANCLLPLSRDEMTPRPGLHVLDELPLEHLFPGARDPDAARAGLFLRLGAWKQSHGCAQNLASQEGSYWHAIVHRLEPDSWNSNYWFRRVGRHPIFPELRALAAKILERYETGLWDLPPIWDPASFITFCDQALNDTQGPARLLAIEIQDVEWKLLFTWCASPA